MTKINKATESFSTIISDPLGMVVAVAGGIFMVLKYVVKLRDKSVLMEMDIKIVNNNEILKKEIKEEFDKSLKKIEAATHGRSEQNEAVLLRLLDVADKLEKK